MDPEHLGASRRRLSPGSGEAVLRALVKALRRLGESGDVDGASRIAASTWSRIRHEDPAAAEVLNGTLHYLARLPDTADTPHRGPAARSDESS